MGSEAPGKEESLNSVGQVFCVTREKQESECQGFY